MASIGGRMQDQGQWLAATDGFAAAAFDSSHWNDAIASMARLCGFRVGQLIGIGSEAAIPFNFMSDFDPAAIAEFAAIGGGDPAFNPRVRAGLKAPLMKSLAEEDFVTREEFEKGEYYASYCQRHDVPWGCVMPMLREGSDLIGLAIFRGLDQGHITDVERARFEALALHARSAVNTQKLLEDQGALVLKGALEALSLAVFICNGLGDVRAITQPAEVVLADGRFLRIRQGQLRAIHAVDNTALNEAVHRAAANVASPAGSGPSSTVIVRDQNGHPLALEIVPLPRQEDTFGFEPRALVVVRTWRRDDARTILLLQAAYRLTAAEAQVTMRLAEGDSPENIALARGVAVSTVRVQIRTIYIKLGVRRQSELVARMGCLR